MQVTVKWKNRPLLPCTLRWFTRSRALISSTNEFRFRYLQNVTRPVSTLRYKYVLAANTTSGYKYIAEALRPFNSVSCDSHYHWSLTQTSRQAAVVSERSYSNQPSAEKRRSPTTFGYYWLQFGHPLGIVNWLMAGISTHRRILNGQTSHQKNTSITPTAVPASKAADRMSETAHQFTIQRSMSKPYNCILPSKQNAFAVKRTGTETLWLPKVRNWLSWRVVYIRFLRIWDYKINTTHWYYWQALTENYVRMSVPNMMVQGISFTSHNSRRWKDICAWLSSASQEMRRQWWRKTSTLIRRVHVRRV